MIIKVSYQPIERQEIYEAMVAIDVRNLDEALSVIKEERYLLPHRKIISMKEVREK